MNPGETAYLRGLEKEFEESSNAIRLELNRFEDAGLINAIKDGNKKVYKVNTGYPLFREFQSVAMKHFGVDQILEHIIARLGEPRQVYLIGRMAQGLDTNIIDLVIVSDQIDRPYLAQLVEKVEKIINRKIRTMVLSKEETGQLPEPCLLLYGVIDTPSSKKMTSYDRERV